jgi:hypothetical protein
MNIENPFLILNYRRHRRFDWSFRQKLLFFYWRKNPLSFSKQILLGIMTESLRQIWDPQLPRGISRWGWAEHKSLRQSLVIHCQRRRSQPVTRYLRSKRRFLLSSLIACGFYRSQRSEWGSPYLSCLEQLRGFSLYGSCYFNPNLLL